MVGTAVLLWTARGHAQGSGGVPWFGYGPVDTAYAMSIDTTMAMTGRRSLLLESLPGANVATWIAAQQIVDARSYRNRHVRIRAYLRAQQATGTALWIAVEGFAGTKPATLLSDSLVSPLRGTTSWREAAVVFAVDARATCIRYGALLHGTGAVWLDDVDFDTVTASLPVTVPPQRPTLLGSDGPGQPNCAGMLPRPTDLDFEQPPS